MKKKHKLGFKVKSVIVWDKMAHGMGDLKRQYGPRYESVIFAPGPKFAFPGRRPVDIVPVTKINSNKLVHPNEKPVPLMVKLIEDTTTPGAVLLDPFIGAGSTAVAAIKTGRHFIGFELDPKYHEIAVNRVKAARKEIEGI